MSELLVCTTLLASFLGGLVALFAPCCVSVMLPAYLATGFRHRGGVVAATLIFGAGVATVIVPIGLGATALSSLLVSQHLWLFSLGGLLMIVAGVAVLAHRRCGPHDRSDRRAAGDLPDRHTPAAVRWANRRGDSLRRALRRRCTACRR